jgi:hypothetical protein
MNINNAANITTFFLFANFFEKIFSTLVVMVAAKNVEKCHWYYFFYYLCNDF